MGLTRGIVDSMSRTRVACITVAVLAAFAVSACQSPPPGPAAGRAALASLVVAAPYTGAPAYSRDLYPHWRDLDGNGCDAREDVLIAESTVTATIGAGCTVTSGRWVSAYDGVVTTDPSTFDIDHMVPLANAHQSGAWAWDTAKRTAYANDITHPRSLIAVTASSNRSKGDKSPDAWKPPLASDFCQYATDWSVTKAAWGLTVTAAEKAALASMLDTCPN